MSFTYAQLADAAELDACNKRGHLNTVRALAAKGKRPQTEVDRLSAALPKHEAIAKLMRRAAEQRPGETA